MEKELKKGRPVDFNEINNIFNKSNFNSEKELCDFIENNIIAFNKDVFGTNLISYERESFISDFNKPISPHYYKKIKCGNKTRIDFKIKTDKGILLVECKNPKNTQRELNRAIAQVLDYIIIAENGNQKFFEAWLIITKINLSLIQIIKRFNLPINICLIDKKQIAVWKNNDFQK